MSIAVRQGLGKQRIRSRRVEAKLAVTVRTEFLTDLAWAVDLSPDGMFVATPEPYEADQAVEIDCVLDGARILLKSRIARVDRNAGIALEFIGLGRPQRLALVAFVSRRLAEEEALKCLDATYDHALV